MVINEAVKEELQIFSRSEKIKSDRMKWHERVQESSLSIKKRRNKTKRRRDLVKQIGRSAQ